MLCSPDRPCTECGCKFFDLKDNGRVCLLCLHFMEDIPLDPKIVARIINARIEEARGEEND
jgi:hypothetical protein